MRLGVFALLAALAASAFAAPQTATRASASAKRPTAQQRATRPAKASAASARRPVAKSPVAKRPVAKRPSAAAKPSAKPAPAAVPPGAGKGPMTPYRGAIAVDADNGRVLFADNVDRTGYPASCTKIMTFLLVMEDVAAGRYSVSDRAVASAYAASMEPSSVGLMAGQSMTIDDLLYSLMVKSANDAAIVLAEYSAYRLRGRKAPPQSSIASAELVDAFVSRMNRRARELDMRSTRYASPNGLPPGPGIRGKDFDVSTARDLSRLARAVAATPGALRYCSPASKAVVDGKGEKLLLQNHNYFVKGNVDPKRCCESLPECDGLKTGYTQASGSSIVLTAKRRGRRVVVVVLGSSSRAGREAAADALVRDALASVSLW